MFILQCIVVMGLVGVLFTADTAIKVYRGSMYSIVKDAPLPLGGVETMRSLSLCSRYMASQHVGILWFLLGYPPTAR